MTDDDKPEPWSMRRWKQFRMLEKLLIDCESLDRGNCVLGRIKRLIAGAGKLRKWDYEKQHRSFMKFLEDQALYEYASRKRKRKKPV